MNPFARLALSLSAIPSAIPEAAPRENCCSRLQARFGQHIRSLVADPQHGRREGWLCAGLSVWNACRDTLMYNLPAKLSGLAVFLCVSKLATRHAWVTPALGAASTVVSAACGAALGQRGARALQSLQAHPPEPGTRADRIVLAGVVGVAVGTLPSGSALAVLLGSASTIGMIDALAVRRCLTSSQHGTALVLACGMLAGCVLLVSLRWLGLPHALRDTVSENPDSFYARQAATMLEALLTETLRDCVRTFGPAPDRPSIPMRAQFAVALAVLPFYVGATVGIGGLAGLALKPAAGQRRYDEYVPGVLAASCAESIKSLLTTLFVMRSAQPMRAGRGLGWPGPRVLQRVPSRLLLLSLRNSVHDLVLHQSGRATWAAGISQLAYAVAVFRDPVHELLDRGERARLAALADTAPLPTPVDQQAETMEPDVVVIHLAPALRK
jgi:hypothetical protein